MMEVTMFDYIDLNVKECNFKKPPLAQYLKMAYSNLEMQQGHRQKAKVGGNSWIWR